MRSSEWRKNLKQHCNVLKKKKKSISTKCSRRFSMRTVTKWICFFTFISLFRSSAVVVVDIFFSILRFFFFFFFCCLLVLCPLSPSWLYRLRLSLLFSKLQLSCLFNICNITLKQFLFRCSQYSLLPYVAFSPSLMVIVFSFLFPKRHFRFSSLRGGVYLCTLVKGVKSIDASKCRRFEVTPIREQWTPRSAWFADCGSVWVKGGGLAYIFRISLSICGWNFMEVEYIRCILWPL